MNITKTKENGKTIYRARDNKGKHVMYLGTAETIVEAVKFYKDVKKDTAQVIDPEIENPEKTAQLKPL